MAMKFSGIASSSSSVPSHYQNASIPKVVSPPQFFEHTKKGEVNELRQLLKNTLNDKDQNKRKEVVKKVIAFMTLGVDVSRLFGEMCMASFTNDISQKKMIYLYLGNYAESHPDLAIMAINTYVKDCQHSDAKIRGLALRSLCSLRFSGSYEYMQPAIMEALKDSDPYVRKTAIMGCIKLYYMAPATVKNSPIVDTLYAMIKDSDTLVISNSIQALNEILYDEGGIAVSSKMTIYLLNRIKEFNEWGQTILMDLVSKYTPKTENELYDIMNLLEDRLKHACTSIVLGCIKVFLNYTIEKPQLHQQVFKRIQSPLITLMTSGEVNGLYELTFTVLSHIYFIVTRGGNKVFENDYKQFYCKVDEPSYIKLQKLDILTQIASENNLGDILNELGEYVTDIDTNIARKSIQALGGIAMRLPKMAAPIVKQLTTFVSMQSENVTNETFVAFGDILRKYKSEYKEIIAILSSSLDYITEPQAKIGLVWILGEYGEFIEDSPYILENLVNAFKEKENKTEEDKENIRVKHALLSAAMKLFVKRAPEMQPILGNLFVLILNNEKEDIDLKERAAFYYRLLQTNIDDLSKVLRDNKTEILSFLEDELNSKENNNIDFNSLSVIYQKPASKFIKSYEHFNIQRNKELSISQPVQPLQDVTEDNKKDHDSDISPEQRPELLEGEGKVINSSKNEAIVSDLLDLNFGPSMASINREDLAENIEIEAEAFQSSWLSLNEGGILTRFLKNAEIDQSYLESLFSQSNVYCVAAGEMEGEMKFYFFSQHLASGKYIFMEVQISKNNRTLNFTVKSEDDELAAFYSKYIEQIFIANEFI